MKNIAHVSQWEITFSLKTVAFQVHVNLMMLEARMQAELLYALRTLNRYMTN